MLLFKNYIKFGEALVPFDNCEHCKQVKPLLDVEPEVAWPSRFLCPECTSDMERRRAWEAQADQAEFGE